MQDKAAQAESLALRDIHLPDPVSWWPPAPGWWLLLGGIFLLAIMLFMIKKIRQRKRLQKVSLAELEILRTKYDNDKNKKALAQSLSVLLRRASISFQPRNNVASLTGNQWLQHLDNTTDNKGFETGTGNILITAPYLPDDKQIDVDTDSLLSLCESWLREQPHKQKPAGEQT
jgi:hypothetical protein